MTTGVKMEDFVRTGGLDTISAAVPDDLFLACASFEPRSAGLVRCLQGRYRVKRSEIYVNREFEKVGATASNAELMADRFAGISDSVGGITLGSWEDAVYQFTVLRRLIAPQGPSQEPLRITVDITTFNREALLACMTILRWAYPRGTFRFVYISPEEYNPAGRAELKRRERSGETLTPSNLAENLWLSRGFRHMRNAIGFPGLQKPKQPALLILLPGFEIERALTIVDTLEPSLVLLGKPVDATRDEFYERSVQAKNQMLRLFRSRQPVEEFDFSCKDVGATRKALEKLLHRFYDSHNIFLSSHSTKPTLIGVFLTAEKFDGIQVTCTVPGEYNVEDYSSGAHAISFFTMGLQ
jgi:hypothetical protein